MSTCRWPGCKTLVTYDMWGCKRHWFVLPKEIRDGIRSAYEDTNFTKLSEHFNLLRGAHQAAQDWIAANTVNSDVPPANRIVKCAGCDRDLIWLPTRAGKNMPVHADTVQPGDTLYQHGKHEPHWGACPRADEFRKKKP